MSLLHSVEVSQTVNPVSSELKTEKKKRKCRTCLSTQHNSTNCPDNPNNKAGLTKQVAALLAALADVEKKAEADLADAKKKAKADLLAAVAAEKKSKSLALNEQAHELKDAKFMNTKLQGDLSKLQQDLNRNKVQYKRDLNSNVQKAKYDKLKEKYESLNKRFFSCVNDVKRFREERNQANTKVQALEKNNEELLSEKAEASECVKSTAICFLKVKEENKTLENELFRVKEENESLKRRSRSGQSRNHHHNNSTRGHNDYYNVNTRFGSSNHNRDPRRGREEQVDVRDLDRNERTSSRSGPRDPRKSNNMHKKRKFGER